jgi:hypothetical protein
LEIDVSRWHVKDHRRPGSQDRWLRPSILRTTIHPTSFRQYYVGDKYEHRVCLRHASVSSASSCVTLRCYEETNAGSACFQLSYLLMHRRQSRHNRLAIRHARNDPSHCGSIDAEAEGFVSQMKISLKPLFSLKLSCEHRVPQIPLLQYLQGQHHRLCVRLLTSRCLQAPSMRKIPQALAR